MTKAELLEELKACTNLDTEGAHMEADKLLLKYIGDPEIQAAFEEIDKWYA